MVSSFEWPVRVYIEDTDAGGIVYYVNYLKFMERARTEFLRHLGFGKDYLFAAEQMFVVHSANNAFLKPARLDDELRVSAEITKLGKTFIDFLQQVYRISETTDGRQQRELLSEATIKIACVDKLTIKPKRIPAAIIQALQE